MEVKIGDKIKSKNHSKGEWLKVVRLISPSVLGCVVVNHTGTFHKVPKSDIIDAASDLSQIIYDEDECEAEFGFEVDRSYFEMTDENESGGGGEGDEENDSDEDGDKEKGEKGDEESDSEEGEGDPEEGDSDQESDSEGEGEEEDGEPTDSEERGEISDQNGPQEGETGRVIKTVTHNTDLVSEKISAPIKKRRF